MRKKTLKKWKLKREKGKKEMLKITESANVAHYVGCDRVENAAVDFAAVFFSFYHQFPHIKYKHKKKGAKKIGRAHV